MAQQIQNARGTLTPGQTISVNKYTVQVERYLSQGGFAHVYLVRTATPVYGTTHHVLKRIAVASDSMLTDVKKEVDIMRILKGHPNIVHLIDAAWHRMSNGTYEVFILMEFCPGGGIIDMMNRRLRERLTEAEILNIFVDVCEGVAAMHNLRPALLHRDLKVENILQASATSYKLCDFGSATSVSPKPPSTTQEIRALEADLNRHTTLQYRAPEMVDPYLRRPVDEKSDVWALGVLLYKLCYYTTPFEEHGPLAILNVQYRIPPYPVYSTQMNSLIASMLREHGTHRPSIFEILDVVHQFRGTQSRFSYSIPEKQPLSPRTTTSNFPSSTLDDLITYKPQQPTNNPGTQAREKVLEAIAPMRRGRPTRGTSRSPSPSKEKSKGSWLEADLNSKFVAQEDQAWKAVAKAPGGAVRGHKSGVITSDAWRVKPTLPSNDGWELKGNSKTTPGFESDFSANGFGDSFDLPAFTSPALQTSSRNPTSASIPIPARGPQMPSNSVPSSDLARLAPRSLKSKDAFDGLGFSEKPPAPTLGEVRKARTGLVIPLEQSFTPRRLSPQPPPSPQPSRRPPPTFPEHQQPESLAIEDRFPSLEELDRRIFGGAEAPLPPNPKADPKSHKGVHEKSTPALSYMPRGTTGSWRPTVESGTSVGVGHRSQNVTGTGMRDSKNAASTRHVEPLFTSEWAGSEPSNSGNFKSSRPSPTRNHNSSTAVKQSSSHFEIAPELATPAELPTQGLSVSSASSAAHDWLTGDEEGHASNILSRLQTHTTPGTDGERGAPVLRDSPSKRASFFEKSPHLIPEPLEGDVEQGELLPPPAFPSRPLSAAARTQLASSISSGRKSPPLVDMGQSTSTITAPGVDIAGDWSSDMQFTNRRLSVTSSSDDDDDEGPEDITGYGGSYRGKSSVMRNIQRKDASKSKRRQSSVHDLVDLWGGSTMKDREKDSKPDVAPKEQKRRSVILPSSTAIAAASSLTGLPRSSSPPHIPISSPSTPQKSHIRSRSREANRNWKPPSATSALIPPPLQKSTSSGPLPSSRSRPQSMLIFPTSKPIMDNGLPSPGLEPPQGLRTISASRRTSISNMVHRYEEMGSGGKQSPVVGSHINTPPPISAKPAGLRLPTSENLIGPGSSNTRYTNISPLASPIKSMSTNLPVPTTDDAHGVGSRRGSPVGFSERTSPRRSPVEYVRKKSIPTTTTNYSSSINNAGWDDSGSSGEPKSPSPERAYAGVGKLIDQWQKKAEESGDGKKSGMPAKRFGVGAR